MHLHDKLILRRTAIRMLALVGLTVVSAACRVNGSSNSGAAASVVRVVAAENFYGDIVQQLGGGAVRVTSILVDPNADPHEYESSADNAKAIASAGLVIVNGIGYDTFMDKLLAASPSRDRIVINAGELTAKKEGDNPHIWYDVPSMERLADRITESLQKLEPSSQADFATKNQRFKASLVPLKDRIASLKTAYSGQHLTQTEPVFGYMGDAIGLQSDNGEFQHAIEEGNDPSPQSVAQISAELTGHAVKAFLYNSQTTSPVTTRVKEIAKQNGVPIIGVSETEPAGRTYQVWMLTQLDELRKALGG